MRLRRSTRNPINLDDLERFAEFMEKHDLSELRIEEGRDNRSIVLRRGPAASYAAPAAPAPAPAVSAETPENAAAENQSGGDLDLIRAQMVGTFYRSPSPDEPPFVEAGANVKEGETLCIIEAMKLMNLIESDFNAEIVEILVENAAPVEYGQPLFRVIRL